MKKDTRINQEFQDLIAMIHFTEEVTSKLCGTLDKEEIFKIIEEEFLCSEKYTMSILMMNEDKKNLKVITSSAASQKQSVAKGEKLTGLKLKDSTINLNKSSIYRRVVQQGETVQVYVSDIIKELFPLPVAKAVIKLFGYENSPCIISPLKIHKKIVGAFAMRSHVRADYLVPSVTNLVKHISKALELSYEYEERKKLEELLISKEKKYKALVEDMPVLMCRFTPSGELTFVNRAYCDYFNITKYNLMGQNFFQFIPETERETVRNHYLSLDRNNPFITYEHKVIDKSGNTRWQQWIDRALFNTNNKVEEYQSIGIDITKIKDYEEKINRLDSAMEQSIDGIAICNMKEELIYVNSSFAHMHGFSPGKMTGMKIEEFQSPEHNKDYKSSIEYLKVYGFWQGEIDHKTKEGSVFPTFISATLLKDRNGKPEGILTVMKDISQIVKTKNEIERKNIALKELLSQIETEKQEIKDQILENVDKIILPLFAKLKEKVQSDTPLLQHIEFIEKNVKDICSPFIKTIINNFTNLTPRELEICTMVKNGMTNKEIAQGLSISVLTVVKHRQYIRKKLGLTNKSINLFSYLHKLDE